MASILFRNLRIRPFQFNIDGILNILRKKNMSVITNVFPKLKPVKDVVRALSKKPIFRRPFERQHVKVSQTLVKSAWQHFYHNFSLPWEKITVENVCVSDM